MSTELFKAVNAADVGHARQILSAGAEVNSRDADGATVLMLACHAGNLPMVMVLIEAGADVNAADPRGWTPLMKAAYNAELDRGFADVAQALIGAGNVRLVLSGHYHTGVPLFLDKGIWFATARGFTEAPHPFHIYDIEENTVASRTFTLAI